MKSLLASNGYGTPILLNRLDFSEAYGYVIDIRQKQRRT